MEPQRTIRPQPNSGFSLVELLIVVAIGSTALFAAMQVVMTQARQYTFGSENSQLEGTLRGSAAILASSLLELSASEGDLIAIESDSVRLRAVRGGGTICSWKSVSGNTWYGLPSVSGELQSGDSAFVYDAASDDWDTALIAAVDTGSVAAATIPACFYGDSTTATAPATKAAIRLSGLSGTAKVGAPVRSFQHTTFALRNSGDAGWLIRQVGSDSARALAGPLLPDSGLALSYFDASGSATTSTSAVEHVEIFLRGVSPGRVSGNVGRLADSIRVRVNVRN